jgi:hypothetical protein
MCHHASVRRQPRQVVLCLAALLAIGLGSAGCRPAVQARPRTSPAGCPSRLRREYGPGSGAPAWIISARGLSQLIAAGLPPALLRADFNRPTTLLLVSRGKPDPVAPRASLAFLFESAQAMTAALDRNRVPSSVHYLLLDLESWPLTPLAEQLDPIASLQRAVTSAHAHGKCVIFAPALDLMSGLAPAAPLPALYSHFDQLIVGPGVAASDMLEVQAQHTEGTAYVDVLAPGAIAAARTARPDEPVFVGLSTNPNGRQVTPADLTSLYASAARAGAAGYWLNIAGTSRECPGCGTPQTWVAVEFLEATARAHALAPTVMPIYGS